MFEDYPKIQELIADQGWTDETVGNFMESFITEYVPDGNTRLVNPFLNYLEEIADCENTPVVMDDYNYLNAVYNEHGGES